MLTGRREAGNRSNPEMALKGLSIEAMSLRKFQISQVRIPVSQGRELKQFGMPPKTIAGTM